MVITAITVSKTSIILIIQGILIIGLFTILYFFNKDEENSEPKSVIKKIVGIKQKINEETRQILFDFIKTKLDEIESAVSKFEEFLDVETGYFANYLLSTWESQHTNLFNEIKDKPFEIIQLLDSEIEVIQTFKNCFINGVALRKEFNSRFINSELEKYSVFFSNVENRNLDLQQRIAIITDEDNNLVIAGAGSGKTTTIVGKVNYIIDRYKVNPKEILLISFTNKSASTLVNRINVEGIEAKTFHKFGKDIITIALQAATLLCLRILRTILAVLKN